ncbi:hypothetical protein BJF92_05300 [Rhizobium rhizosphaerae]|uniref:Tetratricopeptide repeat protein n=1 Tax=Xaviernesmea rhizosphaerae TaxID=1672749 RepID=A0A1Q9AFB6_9HYPH|nr:hypothetical protein BJF92_05300 [Xaviernesmea rhizosphaerae]
MADFLIRLPATALVLAFALALPARAADPGAGLQPTSGAETSAPKAETPAASPSAPAKPGIASDDRKATLNALFDALKRERNPEKAREISGQIRLEWAESGSATVNFLMLQAAKAIAENRQTSALDFYDQVIALAPDYSEGWNGRATLHYQMNNYRKSMSDINHVLQIEPRHFGALAGMATILTTMDKPELAVRVWEKFLEIYPAERKAQEELNTLQEKVAGSRT